MVAEVKLYWLIYQMTSASPTSVSRTNRLLIEWREEYASLFGITSSQIFGELQTLNANCDRQSSRGRNFSSWDYISLTF